MSLDRHFVSNGFKAAYQELSEPLVSRPVQRRAPSYPVRRRNIMPGAALACAWVVAAAIGSLLAQAFSPALSGHYSSLTTGSIGNSNDANDEPIDRALAVVLSRTILLRLDDANRTGNYSVFRDRSTPAFRSINSAEDLARIFSWLRTQDQSLATAEWLEPSSLRPTIREKDGIVHVRGTLPDAPDGLSFDLLLQQSAGDWLVFGIAVYRE